MNATTNTVSNKPVITIQEPGAKATNVAASPITSCQIDGETVETVSDFIFLGSKITADGDCSHEIKRHFLLGRKVMSLLFNMLFRLVITFLPRSKRLLIS